jgi:arylsulfatase A-like enzyme
MIVKSKFLHWYGYVGVAFVALSNPVHGATTKPNILLIVADDMGYADVGFHGCKDIPTPNIDLLAASGVRFTSGYVSGPYCSPTRAGLLTGRYQNRFGFEFIPFHPPAGLPLSEKTIADYLKAAGYRTGLVGKWHVGLGPECHPLKRGFDEFFGFLDGAHSYFEATAIQRNGQPVQVMDYTTDAFGREASSFIDRHQKQPWFLYLAFNAVHTPMQATPDRLVKFPQVKDERRRTYDAMLLAMDEAIGRVRQTLTDTGLETSTLVCFISDNGGPVMPETTVNGSCNAPLRGSKRTTLEGGIRVPFVVSWPGHLKPGVYEKPVIQLDLTATALAAAGARVGPEAKLEGVNLLPFLTRANSGVPHEALYWRFGKQMAVRAGNFKLVRYDTNVETQTGKFNQPISSARLYDLAADIGEANDLAPSMPAKVKELQAKWDSWNTKNVKPAWPSAHEKDDGF